ncbi:MAG: hypothetical protein M3O70_05715 [Actinomycetota bacterium]|nr:hypothetical protein [Actinomycetota bacterium]
MFRHPVVIPRAAATRGGRHTDEYRVERAERALWVSGITPWHVHALPACHNP